jgi:hypothetical protein
MASMGKKVFVASLAVASILVLAPYFFFTPHRLTNDDLYTVLAAKGWGISLEPNAYLYMVNIVLGYVLKSLYAFQENVPWHGIFLIVAFALGFWAYLYTLFHSKWSPVQLFLFITAYLAVDLYFLIWLHFTCAALWACQGGFFLLNHLIQTRAWSLKALLLSGTCLALGALLRLSAFFVTALCFAPFIYFSISPIHQYPFKKKLLTACAFILLMIALPVLFNFIGLEARPDWGLVHQQDQVLHDLIDYRNLQYDTKTKPFFDAVDWSQNDFELYNNWFFQDKEKFDYNRLKKLDETLPWIKAKELPELFSNLFYDTRYISIFCLTFGIFLLLSSGDRLKLSLFFIWVLLINIGLFFFMKAPIWVIGPLLVLPLKAGILCLPEAHTQSGESHPKHRRVLSLKNLVLGMSVMFALYFCSYYYQVDKVSQKNEIALQKDIRLLNPQDNQLFIIWHNTIPYEFINVFDDNQNFKTFHIFQLQGFQRSPTSIELLDKFHIKDFSKEIIDHPNIFMICTEDEGILYLKHMEEKYNLSVSLQKVFHSPSFDAYRVLSIKK